MLRTERLKYPERACNGNDLCPSREGDVDFYERIPVAFGLFARVDIPANTTLLEYTGEVFDYQDWYALRARAIGLGRSAVFGSRFSFCFSPTISLELFAFYASLATHSSLAPSVCFCRVSCICPLQEHFSAQH